MSVIAKCACGNRMALADVMAGKSIVCSKCGSSLDVPMASMTATGPAAARKKPAGASGPAIAISPAIIISSVVGIVLLVIVLALYFGPWSVGKQWEAMSSTANDHVTDVVQFALQAYESEHGMFNAAASHSAPRIEGRATFVPPYMAFSMPRRVIFSGKTNQGNYVGTYDTTSGEVTADIETGGFSVGGLVDVQKATGKFHMTGREQNGKCEAEVDGHPLRIVMGRQPRKGE